MSGSNKQQFKELYRVASRMTAVPSTKFQKKNTAAWSERLGLSQLQVFLQESIRVEFPKQFCLSIAGK